VQPLQAHATLLSNGSSLPQDVRFEQPDCPYVHLYFQQLTNPVDKKSYSHWDFLIPADGDDGDGPYQDTILLPATAPPFHGELMYGDWGILDVEEPRWFVSIIALPFLFCRAFLPK
jgi:hypothetical protein